MPVELANDVITATAVILAHPMAKAAFDAANALAKEVVTDRAKALIDDGLDGAKAKLAKVLAAKARQPENHDMIRAIRTAQLRATRYLLAKSLEEAQRANRPTDEQYYREGLNWAEAQLGAVTRVELSLLVADAAPALAGLAPATAGLAATTATWAELAEAVPHPLELFKQRFFGEGLDPGWFGAFQVFLAEQVKTNQRFRDILTSTQLADIQITTARIGSVVDEISSHLRAVAEDIRTHLGAMDAKLAGAATHLSELNRIATDPSPFSIIDEQSHIISKVSTSHALPTWEDYASGRAPSLIAEADVCHTLANNNWVCVVGPPSVGKTTLAFRLTITNRQPAETIHYLDVGDLQDCNQAVVAMRTLSGRAGYIILDNAHHDAQATNKLCEAWRRSNKISKLIILVTRTPSDPLGEPKNSLANLTAEAVKVDALQQDFGRIAAFLYHRARGSNLPDLPPQAAERWRTTFGGQLHAFGFAVLESLAALERGQWNDLTMARAVRWVKRRWVDGFNDADRANANRLAALGAQALELYLPKDALPFPERVDETTSLLGQITVLRTDGRGRDRVRLAEPGWGELLLQAQNLAIGPLLADAAATYPILAIEISRRLKKAGKSDQREAFWREMDQRRAVVALRAPDMSPQFLKEFLDEAWSPGRTELCETVLNALKDNAATFARHAWDPPVSHLGALLKQIAGRGHDVVPLWEALKDHTVDITALGRSPLGHVAGFLKDALELGFDTTAYWDALQQDSEAFPDWVRRESLNDLASLVRVAGIAGRDISPVWKALENILPDKMMTSSIEYLAGLVRVAPLYLLRTAMSDWTPESWGDRLGRRLWGAVWVAHACLDIDREDLAKPLVEALIARRNPADFPETAANSFYTIVLTVAIARRFRIPQHDDFFRVVLPNQRIAREYARLDNVGVICNVLALAGEQLTAAQRARLAGGHALADRLVREMAEFEKSDDDHQRALAIRLLGAVSLNGLAIHRTTLAGIEPSAIEALPTRPPGQHRATTTEVERWQFQMWLGIRTYAQVMNRHLNIGADIVGLTRTLWTATQATRPDDPMTAVDTSMISWLGAALRQEPPRLQPGGDRVNRLLADPP